MKKLNPMFYHETMSFLFREARQVHLVADHITRRVIDCVSQTQPGEASDPTETVTGTVHPRIKALLAQKSAAQNAGGDGA